ncbi:MAG: hypothetical protein JWP89_1743 [Schlesneria sp.]|nr:hypothetical protein [Schlesneria sp.]
MSRYSDFDGYWLFGFLVGTGESLEIDLLASQVETSSPEEKAAFLAQKKFADQLRKVGIGTSQIRSAGTRITRSPDRMRSRLYVIGPLPPHELERDCYVVTCRAEVTLQDETVFAVERAMFVAPHDPSVECRSYFG